MILRVKNWREFQHYSKRRPTWIKLHRKLLDDRVFLQLPDASKALLPLVWLLASEHADGAIPDAITEITFRLRMSEQKASAAVTPLLAAGFLVSEPDDSGPLAERKPNGVSEREGDSKPLRALRVSPDTPNPSSARGSLGGSAHDTGMPKIFLKRIPS